LTTTAEPPDSPRKRPGLAEVFTDRKEKFGRERVPGKTSKRRKDDEDERGELKLKGDAAPGADSDASEKPGQEAEKPAEKQRRGRGHAADAAGGVGGKARLTWGRITASSAVLARRSSLEQEERWMGKKCWQPNRKQNGRMDRDSRRFQPIRGPNRRQTPRKHREKHPGASADVFRATRRSESCAATRMLAVKAKDTSTRSRGAPLANAHRSESRA
jgi:hypothetical protein